MFLSNRGSFRPETSGAYTLRRRGRRRPKSGSAIGACAVARLAGSGGPIGDYYGSANTLLAFCGGLKCNNDFQCLDENGEVIEGLYVLGNIMGDITAVDYPINVAGNSHGRCITFGYLLGHELAEA